MSRLDAEMSRMDVAGMSRQYRYARILYALTATAECGIYESLRSSGISVTSASVLAHLRGFSFWVTGWKI